MLLTGKYYRTIDRDEGTGDTVFEFTLLEMPEWIIPLNQNGIVVCRGKIGIMASGIPLCLDGNVEAHIFDFNNYMFTDKTEVSAKAMLQYISDNELTDAQENKILNKCNNDIFGILKQPEILDAALSRNKKKSEIKKHMIKKLKKISTQEILTRKLMKYGVELNKIETMYQHDIDYDQFTKNPYLCSLYHLISVYQADQFAKDEIQILPYATNRLCGFLMDAMMRYKMSGHVCVKAESLCRYINSRLKRSVYPDTIMNMALLNYCVSVMKKTVQFHIIDDEIYFYENQVWKEETQIIEHIKRLNSEPVDMVTSVKIKDIEVELGMTYNEEQRDSFRLLQTSGIKILTGPPGSGKTATLKGLILAFQKQYPNKIIRLAATTGRAAQVMSNSTGTDAETINKMLNVRPFGDTLHGKNQNDPVEADLIICDEISMLGVKLAACLFGAIKTGSILILVGDEDQLQSVEYGNVLQDLIQSQKIDVCRLKKIVRQSGMICENAIRIKQGYNKLNEDKSFYLHQCSEEDARKLLLKSVQKKDVQVISSVKSGILGTKQLNVDLQTVKNKKAMVCLRYKQQVYYENDPIIMTETNYDKGYYNGDIGIIKGRSKNGYGIIVEFERQTLLLDKNDYHLMELAYAITTHKSQGSEFSEIHILLPRSPENMLTRRILYTAVTRAKKTVHIYDVDGACNFAISNCAEQPRFSLLKLRIINHV